MSTTITPSQTIQNLFAQITHRFDADRDGRLSTQEFSDFLTGLLSMSSRPSASPAAASNAAASADRVPIGTMAGFDFRKLADVTHDTFKYRLARILQYYPNTPEGLRQAMPEIEQTFPGAKIVGSGGDKVDFGAAGVIDLIQSASTGGVAWQFLPVPPSQH